MIDYNYDNLVKKIDFSYQSIENDRSSIFDRDYNGSPSKLKGEAGFKLQWYEKCHLVDVKGKMLPVNLHLPVHKFKFKTIFIIF